MLSFIIPRPQSNIKSETEENFKTCLWSVLPPIRPSRIVASVVMFLCYYAIMLCSYQHKELLDCFPDIKAHSNNQQLIHFKQVIVF